MTAGEGAALRVYVLDEVMCVARLPADAPVPEWLPDAPWWSITRTGDELSVVCEARFVPDAVRQNSGWRMLQVQGPLDFSLTGILHRITAPMAAADISLFALSTFDTDYVLVADADLEDAVRCLRESGVIVHPPD